jgi:hypothetical protein
MIKLTIYYLWFVSLFSNLHAFNKLKEIHIGNWSIKESRPTILSQDPTAVLFTITDKSIIARTNDAELMGKIKCNIDDTTIVCDISNIKITKIPPLNKIPQLIGQYKWIRFIQANGIHLNINFNDVSLLCNYKCDNYTGIVILEKISLDK